MRPGDTLVVWRLSRLARSLKQIIETAHDLEQKKQALKVLTRNIDTGTPEGRLFFHITAAFDEFQRELIVENTRAGLAAARKRGRRGGRPKVLDKDPVRRDARLAPAVSLDEGQRLVVRTLPRILIVEGARHGAPILSIGDAGTFDGIFVTGMMAVLLAGFTGGRGKHDEKLQTPRPRRRTW